MSVSAPLAPAEQAGALAPSRRIELLTILGVLTAFAPLSIDMYLPAFPQIQAGLGTDMASVQMTLASFFLAFAGGQVVYGPLSDRFGRKGPLYAGLGIYVLASFACALVDSVEALIVARFLQALGACAGGVIARAMVVDLFPGPAAGQAFSTLMLVTGLAPMLAPVIGGQLLEIAEWRAIFWLLGGMGLAAMLAMALRLPETQQPDSSRSLHPMAILRNYGQLARNGRFLAGALPGGMAMGGMFAYIAGSPFVLQELHDISALWYGRIFGINALGIFICGRINARLLRSTEPARLLRLGHGVQSAGVLCVLAGVSVPALGLPAILVGLFLYVGSLGLMLPNTTALALSPFRDRAGAASALMGFFQFSLAAVFSSVMGAIHAESALPMVLLMAVGCFSSLGLSALLSRQQRR